MVSIKKPLPNIFQQYLKASENVLQQPIPLAAKQYTKTKCMICNWHTNLQSNKDKGNLYLIYLSGDQLLLFFSSSDDTHTSRNKNGQTDE